MKIAHEFTVSVPVERAWSVLTDLEGIAPCMPGARLTGMTGDAYSGTVRVKVGPVTAEYAGTVRFTEKDDANHHAVIDARGRDKRGAGTASAVITARLRPDGTRTAVTVDTDLKISGRLAQFGSGMIKDVSEKLLAQFVAALEDKLAAEISPDGAPAADSSAATAADGSPADTGTADTGTAEPPTVPGDAQAGRSVTAPAEPAPLDVLSVAGGSIYKRVLPLLAVVIVIVAAVVYLVVR